MALSDRGTISFGDAIAANAVALWTARVLVGVPQLVLVPFLISTVGEAGYGVYALVWGMLVAIDQVSRSFQSGGVKFAAEYVVDGPQDRIDGVVSAGVFVSAVLAVVIGGLLLVFNEPVGRRIGSEGLSLVLVAVGVLVILPTGPFVSLLEAQQRFYVGAVTDTIGKYLGVGAILALLSVTNSGVPVAVACAIAGLALSRLVQVPLAYRYQPGLRVRISRIEGRWIRRLLSFGLGVGAISLTLTLNDTGVRWALGIVVSPEFVGHLTIMLIPAVLLSQLVSPVTMTVFPAASLLSSRADDERLARLLVRSSRYVSVMLGVALIPIVAWLPDALVVWLGPDFAFLGPFATALTITSTLMWATSVSHQTLKGIGRLRAILLIYGVALLGVPVVVLTVGLSAGVNPYGLVVAALGAGHLVCGVLNATVVARVCRVSALRMIRSSYVPIVVAVSVSALLHLFVGRPGATASVVIRITVPALVTGGYLVFALKAWVLAEDRERVRGFARRLVRRVFGRAA